MSEEEASDAVTALHDLSATDMIAGFRARQFSPSDVFDDLLAHVALWEPHIKALYAFDPDGARAAAKASTERWQQGEPMGPLDGVPVTIKDNIATRRGRTAPHRYDQARPGRKGRPARRAAARSGQHHLFQDHDAGFRHVVVRLVELSPPHPQSLG